jgi:hypothetical protein
LFCLPGINTGEHFSKCANNSTVFACERIRIVVSGERERSWRAAVEHRVFDLFHFVHVRHVVCAGDDPASVHKPSMHRIEFVAAVVVRDFDQLDWLVFLKAFRDGTVSTANVVALSIYFSDHTGLPVDVTRSKAAHFFRAPMQAPLTNNQKSAHNQQEHQCRV